MKKVCETIKTRIVKPLFYILLPLGGGWMGGSCSDFFDQESDHVLYANHEHLDNAVDTIYSVTGILNKLQVIADRTILLGEVRADLVDLTTYAASDLRDVANFNVGDDNQYNVPRDYYAIINNCNYFIAHADTAMRSNRNENIFMREYAAVKAIRAWTYLQLVLNYGRVPFVTDPILTKDEAELDYPQYDLKDVCQYFLNDLSDIPEAYNTQYPGYRTIRGQASQFFWFPLSIVRADLNLWAGNYREAALHYYKYISERNGMNSTYPTGAAFYMWMPGSATWNRYLSTGLTSYTLQNESYSSNSELITMIPGDSIRAEGYYSELRNLFNSTDENNDRFSITPSTGMQELSPQRRPPTGTLLDGVVLARQHHQPAHRDPVHRQARHAQHPHLSPSDGLPPSGRGPQPGRLSPRCLRHPRRGTHQPDHGPRRHALLRRPGRLSLSGTVRLPQQPLWRRHRRGRCHHVGSQQPQHRRHPHPRLGLDPHERLLSAA